MKISLVIPAYNEEKYLGACLEQAIKVGQNRWHEIIVVNNASTDRTAEVAARFPNVKVVTETDKGLTKARQRGFKEARGDFLVYIDADTRPTERWFQKLVMELKQNPDLATLSGPYHYYDLPRYQQFMVKLYWYLLAYPAYLAIGYMAIGGNFAISRKVLEQMNGFDTSITFYGEDTNIARRARQFGKVKFIPNLTMPTSGRRLAGQGMLTMAKLYALNFLSEVIRHQPATKDYQDVR